MLPGLKPLWLVCEDGTEYLDRFTRFLGAEFRFAHALCAGALLSALGTEAAGIILDLDFRRTPRDQLVDENGATTDHLSDEKRRRLAESQGILILRLLRARGSRVPVLLFADLTDEGQAAYLEQSLAPLSIVPSHEGLLTTAARMHAVGLSTPTSSA